MYLCIIIKIKFHFDTRLHFMSSTVSLEISLFILLFIKSKKKTILIIQNERAISISINIIKRYVYNGCSNLMSLKTNELRSNSNLCDNDCV